MIIIFYMCVYKAKYMCVCLRVCVCLFAYNAILNSTKYDYTF